MSSSAIALIGSVQGTPSGVDTATTRTGASASVGKLVCMLDEGVIVVQGCRLLSLPADLIKHASYGSHWAV
jgi:hypothetical protein